MRFIARSRATTTPTSKAGRSIPSASARKSDFTRIREDLGRLRNELYRALRLVVDTGVHGKHWSREQMVDYWNEHLPPASDAEMDRYIAWPGQALGYKLGQLKIVELRQRAQAELGPKFEIRAFHDEILNAGALPLDVLESRINAWIARTKNK